MKKIVLSINTIIISSFAFCQVGIGTDTPNENLHVVGNIQVTGALRLGGDASTPGDAGEDGNIITKSEAGLVWARTEDLKGAIAEVYTLIGTDPITVRDKREATGGQPAILKPEVKDIPGLVQEIVVPENKSRKLIITATGYTLSADRRTDEFLSLKDIEVEPSQGTFSIVLETIDPTHIDTHAGHIEGDDVIESKVLSSGYTASGQAFVYKSTSSDDVIVSPMPTTFDTSVNVSEGTYRIKLRYSVWKTDVLINEAMPSTDFVGSNDDSKNALKSKLTIVCYAN